MSGKKVCVFSFDDRLFCREAALKASYVFLNDFYVSVGYSQDHMISVSVEAKGNQSIINIDKDFKNELIAQMVRYDIAKTNRAMKELIIGRALYSSFVDTCEADTFVDESIIPAKYSLDDIAVNWFEVHGS